MFTAVLNVQLLYIECLATQSAFSGLQNTVFLMCLAIPSLLCPSCVLLLTLVCFFFISTPHQAFFTLARDIMTKLNRKMNDNSSSGAGGPVKITENRSKKSSFFRCTLL